MNSTQTVDPVQLAAKEAQLARYQQSALATVGASNDTLGVFSSIPAFDAAQRMATALAASTMIPSTFQGNVANCMIALELASRIGASVFMIMQNLDVIHGRPAFRAVFLIGCANKSGRFSPLSYRWQGKQGTDDWGCRCVAYDLASGDERVGPLVTIGLAKAEGWYDKNGSKWKTIPELMLTYRSGSWWTKVYCPEVALGLGTSEEARDSVIDATDYEAAAPPSPAPRTTLEDKLRAQAAKVPDEPAKDPQPLPTATASRPPSTPPPAQGATLSQRADQHRRALEAVDNADAFAELWGLVQADHKTGKITREEYDALTLVGSATERRLGVGGPR